MTQQFFNPIVLFNDTSPTTPTLKDDSKQPHSSTDVSSFNTIPTTTSVDTSRSLSSSNPEQLKQQPSTNDNEPSRGEKDNVPTMHKDVDMDMDVDMEPKVDLDNSSSSSFSTSSNNNNNNVGKGDHQGRGVEDVNKPSPSGAINIDISKKSSSQETSLTIATTTATSSSIFSPPSSYSSSASSSMDVLAKTLSPARVDMHRIKVQRMLQQNSLLWWELVRYTRNLERKEREQEREQEKEPWLSPIASSSPPPNKPNIVYHYHHHHHHHNPLLPPLHPQQQTSRSGRHSSRGRSRRHPYGHPTSVEIDHFQAHGRSKVHMENLDSADSQPPPPPHHHHHPIERDEFSEDYRVRNSRNLSTATTTSSTVVSSSVRDVGEYISTSRTPSPRLSPSPSTPSQTETLRRYSRSQEESSRQFQYQAPTPPPCCQQPHQIYTHGIVNSRSGRDLYHQSRAHNSMDDYSPRGTARYEQGPKKPPSLESINNSNGVNGTFNTLLASPLTSGGVQSSGPSSRSSSPRSRDLSIASTSSYPHQHQRDSPSHYDRSSYHTTSLENGWRNNGAASSRISEFSPHQHHHHHHHSQQQPSLLRSSQSLESLPRPVPVKPFTFIVPGAAAPSSSGAGPSVSGTSNLNNTTSAFTTTASTSQTNDNKNNPVNNNNNSNNNNNNNNSAIDDQGADPNKKRRGNLPKTVTSVLKSWLVQNAIHPYPTEEEKMRLSEATQLSMNQISNWFINARRRILQPILVEAAAAAVAGTDAPMDNVLIVRKGKGSRMQVEMECACVSATAQDQNHAQEHSAQDSSDQGQDQSQCQTSEGQQNEGQKQNEQDQDNE